MVYSISASLKEKTLHAQLTFTDRWTPLCSNCSSTHNWSRTGDRSEGTTHSHHLREEEAAQTQAHITGEQHLPPPDSTPHSTFTQHTTPTHLPGHLLQGLTQSCPSVHPQCALSQSGPRHPTGSSRSHCYHAPTSSSGSPDNNHLHL